MKIVPSGLQASLVLSLAACALLGIASGCKDSAKTKESKAKVLSSDEYWPSNTGVVAAVADAQAAKGAQEDASLSDACFTGGTLNSLGQQKIDMMLKGGVQPPVIYLGAYDDATIALRRVALDNYLKDSGAAPDALVVKSGFNPHNPTPAIENIARLPRVDTGGKAVSPTPDGKGPATFGPGPQSQSAGPNMSVQPSGGQ